MTREYTQHCTLKQKYETKAESNRRTGAGVSPLNNRIQGRKMYPWCIGGTSDKSPALCGGGARAS